MILSFDLFPGRTVTSGENKVRHDFRRSVDFSAMQVTVEKITGKVSALREVNSFFFRRKAS